MNLPDNNNINVDGTATSGHLSVAADQVLSLAVRDLSCSRNDRILFSGLDFSVQSGQLLHIEGENGSGKTSLLKALCGFIEPEQGEVLWQGGNIRQAIDEYHANMLYVGHTNGIKTGLTCVENLRFASALAASVRTSDLSTVLQHYGLGQYEDTLAQLLSSGQRRRLALARLSVCNARLWILDEPFTSLDDKGKSLQKSMFQQHLLSGGIIILTSHEQINWESVNSIKINL